MSMLFKKNDFKTGYKQSPHDSYKSLVNKLDEETKQKLDRQRQLGMIIVVAFVVLLVVVLAVTGIGVDKTQSVSGNAFADKERVLIECFGDSLTEGYSLQIENGEEQVLTVETPYPLELAAVLPELFANDERTWKCAEITVKNYGQVGSVLQGSTSSRLSGSADIVVILYTANNFLTGADYEGTLEANIETITKQGSQVFLMTYPVLTGSPVADKTDQANNYITNTANSLKLPLIDMKSYFDTLVSGDDATARDLFSVDGEHLTQEGYLKMGDYAAECIHNYYFELD